MDALCFFLPGATLLSAMLVNRYFEFLRWLSRATTCPRFHLRRSKRSCATSSKIKREHIDEFPPSPLLVRSQVHWCYSFFDLSQNYLPV
ncbi:hypothetical protein A0H81_10488 [Grifola frondosa]|uniref:Uncharacterized protein n=1 Tax=Grifola frondosa TaxID=5627 RepID=A0A1C7LYK3_GRIFR|nr:hypothetical protein A0H81_10488 [Grifola frondosa]